MFEGRLEIVKLQINPVKVSRTHWPYIPIVGKQRLHTLLITHLQLNPIQFDDNHAGRRLGEFRRITMAVY